MLLYRIVYVFFLFRVTAVLSSLFDTFADYPISRMYSFFFIRNKSIPHNEHTVILFFFLFEGLSRLHHFRTHFVSLNAQKNNVTMRA